MPYSKGWKLIEEWFAAKGQQPFAFQEEAWEHLLHGRSGLVNAPTGFGKTFSLFLGHVIEWIDQHPDTFATKTGNGLQLIWITPLRALAKDIGRAMETALTELGVAWQVGIRSGDTSTQVRRQQLSQMPEILIITPESLHILLSQKNHTALFKKLRTIVCDEWHELLGNKRGVMVELALSRLKMLCPKLRTWGISATIGNLEEAMEVLLGPGTADGIIIKASLNKNIELHSIIPPEIETYPWAGHLGLKMLHQVIPIIENSKTTLLFTNTRGQSEIWYQEILRQYPEFAGTIALHHGSIDAELRAWVEEALHNGILKLVVCTSSLDLGVDFRPVDTVIQVGSPKGVARFLQRAGRSGHSPYEISKIWFVPTHAMELVEAAALKTAMKMEYVEDRQPTMLAWDVLLQYLVTLGVSGGFDPDQTFIEIQNTYCFQSISSDEWSWLLNFLTTGGEALYQYDEYKKLHIDEDGLYVCTNRTIASRHRMHIGTIVSSPMLKVKFLAGGYIGVIEEWFISRLNPGDFFTLGGKRLEFVMIKDMTVLVRKAGTGKSIVPSWMGGRMPLSANLGRMLRQKFNEANQSKRSKDIEMRALTPLFQLQKELSFIPGENELLIEKIYTKDGYHLFVYPFEGRLVHEVMAALLAFRLSKLQPISFSIAMNDYGFELLSDQPIPLDAENVKQLFSTEHLNIDIQSSVNATEMARRKFRDISVISGLVFQGFPGKHKAGKHLQSSSSLIFNVFKDYDPQNLLLKEAFNEAFFEQMEEVRLRHTLERIQTSQVIITEPQKLTPFCFPIKVDSLRETLTSEQLTDRIKKMTLD